MSSDLLLLLTPLRQALERIKRKAKPLLDDPALLEQEEGQDLLDVICMQFLAAGEALKRLEKLRATGGTIMIILGISVLVAAIVSA